MAEIRSNALQGPGLRGLPNVQLGIQTSAEDFGAADARDLARYGQAMQNFGGTVANISAVSYDRLAESEARAAFSNFRTDFNRYADQARAQRKGGNIADLTGDIQNYYEKMANESKKALRQPQAQRLFDQMGTQLRTSQIERTNSYVLQESIRFEKESLEADNNSLMANASDYAYDPRQYLYARQQIHANNQQLYDGSPPEAIRQANDLADLNLTKKVAQSLALNDPAGAQAAVTFLSTGDIRDQFSYASSRDEYTRVLNTYRKQAIEGEQKAIINQNTSQFIEYARNGADLGTAYQNLVNQFGVEVAQKVVSGYNTFNTLNTDYINSTNTELQANANKFARELAVNNPNIQEDEFRRAAYEQFPEKVADLSIKSFMAEREAIGRSEIVRGRERATQEWEALRDAGWDPTRVEGFADLSPDDQLSYYDKAKKWKASTPENKNPNIDMYLDYQAKSTEELTELLRDPAQRDVFITEMGGPTTRFAKAIFDRIDPATAASVTGEGGAGQRLLDTDLNRIKRIIHNKAIQVNPNVDKQQIAATSSVVLGEIEAQMLDKMRQHKVTDYREVPEGERKQIIDNANIYIQNPRFLERWRTSPTPTTNAVEAVLAGRSIVDAPVAPASLPDSERQFYIPDTGGVINTQAAGGENFRIQRGIDPEFAPLNVQASNQRNGGVIIRDLSTGVWINVSREVVDEFAPDGTVIEMQKNASNVPDLVNFALQRVAPTVRPTYDPTFADMPDYEQNFINY